MATPPELPHLDLGRVRGWRKPFAAIQFLPLALAAIRLRRLHPSYTFSFVDRGEGPIGLSAGDVCYSAREEDTRLVSEMVVALEDRRFFAHPGIDVLGILRALKANVLAQRVVQGGSTITQQLVRNTLLTPDRSLTRKLLELILALFVERHYSKREILRLYGDFVYLGPGVRGFEAASRLIYRRSLSQLDADAQCGVVGLLRRPSRDYPVSTYENLRRRQAFIAQRLSSVVRTIPRRRPHSEGAPTPNPISFRGHLKPRWTRVAQQIFAAAPLPRDDVRRIGLTVDRALQGHLDRTVCVASRDSDVDRVAAVVLDNRSGDVVAEAAWARGTESEFSPTFAGNVQPGSTFKPFAVLAAIEHGLATDLRLLSAPFESSFIRNADGSPWRVRNYAWRYRGELTLSEALRHSDNTAIARLTEYLPTHVLQSVYERFRLAMPGQATPAIVLGAVEGGVSLLQIASAYSAIARLGSYVEPRFLRFVQYADGTAWWSATPNAKGVIVASYEAIRVLRQFLSRTTPSLVPLGFSGKTGTTRRGSLVAAYNDFVSAAIWLGYKESRIEGGPKGLSALRVLERFVTERLLGHKRDPFAI